MGPYFLFAAGLFSRLAATASETTFAAGNSSQLTISGKTASDALLAAHGTDTGVKVLPVTLLVGLSG